MLKSSTTAASQQHSQHSHSASHANQQPEEPTHLSSQEEKKEPSGSGHQTAPPPLTKGTEIVGIVGYMIEEKVFEGGQGVVYKASVGQSVSSDRLFYALKVPKSIKRSSFAQDAAVWYFKLNPADCPHLALLSDVVLHPQPPRVPILVMEYAHSSLNQWLNGCAHCCKDVQRPLRCSRCFAAQYCSKECQKAHWAEHKQLGCKNDGSGGRLNQIRCALQFGIQTLRGLHSLHAENLVHQDLKPANVLLFTDQVKGHLLLKLTDFGLVTAASEDKEAGFVSSTVAGGTRTWMSPEQLARLSRKKAGEKFDDLHPGCDLWAFGLLLASLLPGSVRRAVKEYRQAASKLQVKHKPNKQAVCQVREGRNLALRWCVVV